MTPFGKKAGDHRCGATGAAVRGKRHDADRGSRVKP